MVPAPLRRFARQLYRAGWRLSEHDGLMVAGYMAFAAFTSLFPFLIFLAALASVLGTRETADETVKGMFLFLPPDVASTLAPAVHQVMAGHHGGLLTFGVLATLWTASSGVEALRDALNRAYEVKDLEPLWWRRLQSMAVVVLGALVLFVASLAVVLGPVLWRLVEFFGRPSAEEAAGLDRRPLRPRRRRAGRGPAGTAPLAAATITCRRGRCCRGCCSRSLLWLVGASLFSLYLGTVADYSLTYGSLGRGGDHAAVLLPQRRPVHPRRRVQRGPAQTAEWKSAVRAPKHWMERPTLVNIALWQKDLGRDRFRLEEPGHPRRPGGIIDRDSKPQPRMLQRRPRTRMVTWTANRWTDTTRPLRPFQQWPDGHWCPPDRALNSAHHKQDHHDDQNQPKAAARNVAPTLTIGPSRQRTDQQKYQDDEQNGPEHHLQALPARSTKSWLYQNITFRTKFLMCRYAPQHCFWISTGN